MIYEIKIGLRDVSSSVWRKIELDSNATFHELYEILQIAFDWKSHHQMRSFLVYRTGGNRIKNVEITPKHKVGKKKKEILHHSFIKYDEKDVKLSDWLKTIKDRVIYVDDAENGIEYEIVLEKIIRPEKGVLYPICTSVKNIESKYTNFTDISAYESKCLVKIINERIATELTYLVGEVKDNSAWYWKQLFIKAKELHASAPWKGLHERQVFSVNDQHTGDTLYVSVLGSEQDIFGLLVFLEEKCIEDAIDKIKNIEQNVDRIMEQRSLLLSYESRIDLLKEDYELIKLYDIPFRGKKAWPQFKSISPGQTPRQLDEIEAKMMLGVMAQLKDMRNGLHTGIEIANQDADIESAYRFSTS
ncbi:plasmid pRiA4b ORF-3 family protein [Virgibacillus soli]|uniref:Plasmid pRiA4b ORF-3 family protein n=1 Tax=Paracerasibacillus soli TaxID=480284 RepID=A0ABU5CRI4_9BACI|nr:plasmid pRiA4b ORF-3 family protein [Virgibacillus soli]MDY0408973.1 plasmid pRiA4b ORF-3 family protein [Virgibacillus soli]